MSHYLPFFVYGRKKNPVGSFSVDYVFFARAQMGLSLAFHIIFASIGMTMPVLMALAEWRWLRTKDPMALELTKAWAKGTAVFFAIGAVSGTVLAFELGLLFPEFMLRAGPTIGLAFALEGFAFFTEAIFLGIYLYGWDRVSPRLHFLSGIVVAVSGLMSAVFVTCANAWMNAPSGDHPLAPFLSPAVWHEVPHGTLACYVATALAVAAIHARELLKSPDSKFHRTALRLAVIVALPGLLLQPVLGHFSGQQVAKLQPLKFAAMEGIERSGVADLELGPIRIPGLVSFLATNDSNAPVPGLDQFPKADHPTRFTRYSFLIMVGAGMLLLALGLAAIFRWRDIDHSRRFLYAWIAAGPLGFLALETGWMVTELGRQPWVIHGVMRTRDSVVAQPGLFPRTAVFVLLYIVLGIVTLQILRSYVKKAPKK